MGLISILTRKGNYISNISIDSIISESASATAVITKNPVENGADVNDHIYIEPMVFNTTGLVSDIISSITNVTAAAGIIASRLTGGKTRSQIVWDELLALQAKREPFTLIQGLKSYDNVVIQSLSETQDKETGNALRFTATLTEIILVGTEEPPAVTFDSDSTSDKMTPTKNGGLKQVI